MASTAPALPLLALWTLVLAGLQGCGESRAGPEAEEPPPASARELLPRLRAGCEAAIRLGELADASAGQGRVRRLGVLAQQDYRFANRMLARVAGELDVELGPHGGHAAPQDELVQLVERLERELREAAGGEVVERYLRAVVELSEALLAPMRAAHGEADDEYEDLLEDLIPILDQHLELARSLQAELGFAGAQEPAAEAR